MSLSKRSILICVVGALVLALDQATKAVALGHLDRSTSIPVIDGFFDLTLVQNPGGVFGLFRDLAPGARGVLFTVIPGAAIALILLYAWKAAPDGFFARGSLAMILGGALGNLTDRLRFGFVIDFLDFYWRGYHWPAFNVADTAICTGIGLLMLETLRPERGAPQVTEPPGGLSSGSHSP